MAGLFAAHALLRRNIDVHVFERNRAPLAGRGAGIVTHAALDQALDGLGLTDHGPLGPSIARRRTLDRAGRVVGELEFPQINTSWDRLFQVLRGALPDARYHLAHGVTDIEPSGSGVLVHCEDGSRHRADLVIGADGIRSRLRSLVAPHVVEHYAGYVAWRGLVDERDLSPATWSVIGEYFAFCLPQGEQMLGYPVAGAEHDLRVGRRRYNFVWYRPADATADLPRLLTDASGRLHVGAIPPPLIDPAVLDATKRAAHDRLAPAFAEVVEKTQQLFFQPILDLETDRMSFDRVVLIGDAAFVARPHVGAGVTKAAVDAVALANCLAHEADVSRALTAFEALRLPVGRRIIARARHLGAYMQAQRRTPQEQAAAERHRTVAAVMRETASLEFLDDAADGGMDDA
jgi:2-polyprenyl-6-methoxyphenol hydroxylase-like FAD-dependent oxidoreductase